MAAGNSRHVVAATGDQVLDAIGAGLNIRTATVLFGGQFFLTSAAAMGLMRLGSNSAALTRGFEMFINNLNKIEVRSDVTNSAVGVTSIAGATWFRTVFAYKDRFTGYLSLNGVNETTLGGSPDAPLSMLAGDVVSTGLGYAPAGVPRMNGRYAWMFVLQLGVGATPPNAATMEAYMQDPQSFVAAYGPTGSVLANALKIFWPGQCATEADKSGAGNNGTFAFSSGTGPSLGVGDGPSITTAWADVCGVVTLPDTKRYPLPGYNGSGMGTAQSKKAKDFARWIDEALEAPDRRPRKKKTRREREVARELEALLRSLPQPAPVVVGATATPSSIVSVAKVVRCQATGGAVAKTQLVETSTDCPVVRASGGASATFETTPSPTYVPIVPASGIHNPTDEDLSHIADMLYQHLALA